MKKIIVARAKVFSNEGVRRYRFAIDMDRGEVRPYDSIAGHYTTCHSMSQDTANRILKLARKS